MSTREALIREIETQPELILKQVQVYLNTLVAGSGGTSGGAAKDWPAGYFEATAGAFSNERFERPPQPTFELREEW